MAQFEEIAAHPDVYGRLVDSMAPSIWEMDDIKKGILCLLFGGSNQDGAGQNGKFRGEINCLLVGDPGVSKSQLLSYVHKIAPRGIYTSGRGYDTLSKPHRNLILTSSTPRLNLVYTSSTPHLHLIYTSSTPPAAGTIPHLNVIETRSIPPLGCSQRW